MSPKLATVEVAVGTDSDERTGVESGGRAGRVKAGSLALVDAATLMAVSYRQAKRLWRRFKAGGAKALRHRGVERRSNRGTSTHRRQRVLALIRQEYSGYVTTRFGPTLVAEHLASEDGVTIHHETVRRWMLAAGRCCLVTMVDDATSRSVGRFSGEETIWAAAAVLRQWIETHGIPLALYTDWKNVYVRAAIETEQVAGLVPRTQFGRMCAALQIQIIPASSPQAKGEDSYCTSLAA